MTLSKRIYNMHVLQTQWTTGPPVLRSLQEGHIIKKLWLRTQIFSSFWLHPRPQRNIIVCYKHGSEALATRICWSSQLIHHQTPSDAYFNSYEGKVHLRCGHSCVLGKHPSSSASGPPRPVYSQPRIRPQAKLCAPWLHQPPTHKCGWKKY